MEHILDPTRLSCSLHDWDGLESRLLMARDSAVPNGNANGTYSRNGQYSAHLLRRGWLRMAVDDERVELRPGRWLFCFADRIHQELSNDAHLLPIRMVNAWSNSTQLFTSDRAMQLIEAGEHPELEKLAMQLVADMGPVKSRMENPIFTYRWRTRLDFGSFMQHQQHVLQWTVMVGEILQRCGWSLRIPRGIDTRLAKALNVLDELGVAEAFPRDQVQSASGLTIKQLDRMCRGALAMTLRGYWDQRRVHAARFLLDQPGSSVKETAVQLGFLQLSHFSAWFKRHTQLPPRAFRNRGLAQ